MYAKHVIVCESRKYNKTNLEINIINKFLSNWKRRDPENKNLLIY